MKSIVSLTFDDGLRCQFERAVPVLNTFGLPATFFLIANRNSTHDLWSGHSDDWWKIDWRAADVDMLKSVIREGHEIGSHSVSHDPGNLKISEQSEFEARESKRLIEDWIGAPVSSFCYPFYWSHDYLADAVTNAGYQQARGGGVAPEYVPGASFYDVSRSRSFDRFNVDCRQISQNENVSEWLRPGCWHVLTFHGIGDERDGWEPITADRFSAKEGRPNNWSCRAGSRYLYICEDGLVHYCSQQRGTPGIPLENYTSEDLKREYDTVKSCAPFCTISCVHQTSLMDQFREKPRESLGRFFPSSRCSAPPAPVRLLTWIFFPPEGSSTRNLIMRAFTRAALFAAKLD